MRRVRGGGGRTTTDRIRVKLRKILMRHTLPPLPEGAAEKIAAILREAETRPGKKQTLRHWFVVRFLRLFTVHSRKRLWNCGPQSILSRDHLCGLSRDAGMISDLIERGSDVA
jgi:hypothetical protein